MKLFNKWWKIVSEGVKYASLMGGIPALGTAREKAPS